jgi:hypothetical protein
VNIVKWITDSEIELSVINLEFLAVIKKNGIKLFKHPKNGSRLSKSSYYIRYNSDSKYAVGAYDFPENRTLENLCLTLNSIGLVFWGNFKTEISPYDYMRNLQYRHVLMESFEHIQAGDSIVNVQHYDAS